MCSVILWYQLRRQWRPGQGHRAARPVELPEQEGGDRCALLVLCIKYFSVTILMLAVAAVCYLNISVALHVAVTEDQLEVVKHLVSNGAPVNTQEKKNKFTPLMLCLAQQPPQFLEMLQVILKGKPDLSAQDSTGQTVLHLATRTSRHPEPCFF